MITPGSTLVGELAAVVLLIIVENGVNRQSIIYMVHEEYIFQMMTESLGLILYINKTSD